MKAISGFGNYFTKKTRSNNYIKLSCSENGMALTQVYEVLKRRYDDGDVDSPLEFKYISQLRFLMNSIGSWPYKQFGRSRLDAVLSMLNLLLIAVGMVSTILAALYLQHYRENVTFFDVGHILLCMTFEVLFMQRLLLARCDKYREAIKDYLLEFHLFYFKSRSKYVAKIHSQIHVISGLFTIYVICEMILGITLFIFMPWYNNYSRGMFRADRPANATFEHAVYYYWFTEDIYTTEKGYWLLFAFNVPTAYTTTIGLCVFDLLVSLIVLQIWGHLKILKHNLLSLPLPVSPRDGMYSVEENIRIRQLLKENILHHNFIITFVNKCSDAFSEYLFVFYLLMQLMTCILLLEVSSLTADALAKYGPLTIGMHQQLIQVSVLFEMLNSQIHSQIHVISGLFTIYVVCLMVVGITLFNFMPWYNNYSRGMFRADRPVNATFEQAAYYYLFIEDVYTTEISYWLLFAFNVPTVCMTTTGLCVFDLLVSLIVLQMWGHLKILKHNLLSMPLPVSSADGMYSAEENIRIRQLLKENILHHNFIITFVDKCSHAFSEYLFVFYLLMQAIVCILLLEVSSFSANALAKYGPLTIGMHQQLIQVSVLFEMLNSKSEQLIEAVYATPWERMDAGNRRTVAILLQRVQSPVALKAAKVVPVGVTTMSAVLKTAISYYMILKAIAGER